MESADSDNAQSESILATPERMSTHENVTNAHFLMHTLQFAVMIY